MNIAQVWERKCLAPCCASIRFEEFVEFSFYEMININTHKHHLRSSSLVSKMHVEKRDIRAPASTSPSSSPHHQGMRCSLLLPYSGLPGPGLMVPKAEEQCDFELRNCRSLVYVYETQCEACSGTGYTRGGSRRGKRGMLNVCLNCNGLGVQRVTTTKEPRDRENCLILLR